MKARYKGMTVPSHLQGICEVGKHSYTDGGSPNIILHQIHGKLIVGSFVSIGPHCNIFLGSEHRTDFVSTFPFSRIFNDVRYVENIKSKGDVVIGSDVWIGGYVTILSGVSIGHGAVIGAGSVVSKNVEPYTIVAGNPIREIRKRFSGEQIVKLLEIRWWELSDDRIERSIPYLMSSKIDEFISSISQGEI